MMGVSHVIAKPLEIIAGSPFPHTAELRQEYGGDPYISMYEIDATIAYRRRQFKEDLVHFNGLRQIITQLRGGQE